MRQPNTQVCLVLHEEYVMLINDIMHSVSNPFVDLLILLQMSGKNWICLSSATIALHITSLFIRFLSKKPNRDWAGRTVISWQCPSVGCYS